ncbi:Rap1a/Tai family immunity protein [Sphingomonas daechungensis]|uniref:Rap1a/Tai family immunity protein n=1 Tax=Sphingomonas daechungensis TaxID=1176646 RepID=UPI0037845263
MMMVGLLIALSAQADSQVYVGNHMSYVSGNELFRQCEDKEPFGQTICAGYVAGAVDALEFARGINPKAVAICLPQNPAAERGQLTDVVRAYLAAHPERRQLGAATLTFMALRQAFPCR